MWTYNRGGMGEVHHHGARILITDEAKVPLRIPAHHHIQSAEAHQGANALPLRLCRCINGGHQTEVRSPCNAPHHMGAPCAPACQQQERELLRQWRGWSIGNRWKPPLPQSRPFEKPCCDRGVRILCGTNLRFSSVPLEQIQDAASCVTIEYLLTNLKDHLPTPEYDKVIKGFLRALKVIEEQASHATSHIKATLLTNQTSRDNCTPKP